MVMTFRQIHLIYLAEQNIGTEWARNTSSPYGTFTINAGFRKIGQYLVVVTPLASDGKVGNNKNWSDPALLIVK
ncbi:hypothetical protein PkoCFBP13504_08285 [Pseudomonas koreensis]|uniref:hypothetical protein n=1 Tax=Pseudomonas koreensis TaxID=198620 RepID=UPI00113600DE|nr:hypothetical protein [Pseudomonas koreensis]TKJ85969.1 hypothetical protein PkoCFBP13504_08285 [Pseudomonas koreensis]